jgi:nucleotide-binding universal stress UspA family protein
MAMQAIFEDEHLKVTVVPGSTGRATVSFTGIGLQMHGQPVEEFARTLAEIDDGGTRLFVIDKERTWYERTHEEVVRVLSPLVADHDDVCFIGNSMGGFGAMLFAGVLPRVRATIAFVPQFSVTPRITLGNETRFERFTSRIEAFALDHALHFGVGTAKHHLVFGGEADAWHIAQFEERLKPQDEMLVMGSSGHNAAAILRKNGLLAPLLRDIVGEAQGLAPTVARLRALAVPSRLSAGGLVEEMV